METTLAILGIATGLLSLAGAFITVGREKQARVDLERRHGELAKEARAALKECKDENTRLAERLGHVERQQTALETRNADLRDRLEEVKREKASTESVNSLRESIGRVEGTMLGIAQRIDMLTQELMKKHTDGE